MADWPICCYCYGDAIHGGVVVCAGCKLKKELDLRDTNSCRRQLSASRSEFFRLSKENQRLREYIIKLEAEAKKKRQK